MSQNHSHDGVRRALICCCLVPLLGVAWAGCGADDSSPPSIPSEPGGFNNTTNNANNTNNSLNNGSVADMGAGPSDMAPFIPETEEFLVKSLASTSSYVFVPNSAEGGSTVARIDGRDYQVTPLRVGLEPTQVAATEIEGVGAVAYTLCSGSSQVAVIRADELAPDGKSRGRVNMLKIPREVNAMAMAPDGRHALLYIDPKKPLPAGASVASLQTLAVVRLGLQGQADEVFQLSVTRQIREVEFSEDGRLAMIVGQEGVNLIELGLIQGDSFIGPLDLGVSSGVLPVADLEVELARDGSFLVARSSDLQGLLIKRLDAQGTQRLVSLPGIPTDIDLLDGRDGVDGMGAPQIFVTLRDAQQAHIFDVDEVLNTPEGQEPARQAVELRGVQAGLAQLSPDQAQALLYSSLELNPSVGIFNFEQDTLRVYQLRNQIRSVALGADGQSALFVHRPQAAFPGEPATLTPQRAFERSHGLTLFHLPTGYQRPITLGAEPLDLIMTQDASDSSIVYLMLRGQDPTLQGVMRLNLSTARADFYKMSRLPSQLGLVAGKVFIVQDADQGRITFMDVNSGQQRTVSGYELNARID